MGNVAKSGIMAILLLGSFIGGGFIAYKTVQSPSDDEKSSKTNAEAPSLESPVAFLYQYVGMMQNGMGKNGIRIGTTENGSTIDSSTTDALAWSVGGDIKYTYGDPVFSYLQNGMWGMTSWTAKSDPRGANFLLYHEASCPTVNDADVIAIGPSSATGCVAGSNITGGKTSQIFAVGKDEYVFHMIGGEIYLAHLSDKTHRPTDLDSMCVLEETVSDIDDLDWGSSTKVLAKADIDGLLLSDTAMGKRADGTWVLFVKGIESDNGCKPNTTCELCARGIYRTTSTDLINWSSLEKVVTHASVPEATTMPDGTVWVYWQDFSAVCEADDQKLASRAPISGAYEEADTYDLSEPITLEFPDEDFETSSKFHYATNANPVALPNDAAYEKLEACLE